LGSLDVAGTRPAGVFTAGSAQKMVNLAGWQLGRRIVILGSGDVGMVMADAFTRSGARVLAVVEQGRRVGGLARNKRRFLDTHNIPLLPGATIDELYGSGRLQGVHVVPSRLCRDADKFEPYRLDCDTLVTSVGLIPELELLRGAGGRLHGELAVVDPASGQSTLPWLFVAGNARKVQSYADNVTNDGARAGRAAAHRLQIAV
jgi:NADPH-dependent 2,4-dienoyl-CoA reductase/sulfur reductase-like enzyme